MRSESPSPKIAKPKKRIATRGKFRSHLPEEVHGVTGTVLWGRSAAARDLRFIGAVYS